uniref:Uncharacterized protein n=1 Tax=Oryza sativa subsp. japonica TaxID=39947 RepID=Q6YZ36_ORYSJ|nr:hypothetical protein [Oryza sativa Japonica Group]
MGRGCSPSGTAPERGEMVTALLGLAVEGGLGKMSDGRGVTTRGEAGGANGAARGRRQRRQRPTGGSPASGSAWARRGELEIEDGRGGFEGGMGAGDVGEVELELAQKFGEKWGRGWRSGRQPRPHGRTCAREAGGGSFSGDVGRPGFPCGCRRRGWRKGEELTGGASGPPELEIEAGRGGSDGGMGAGDVGEVELESERKFGEKWGRGWRSGRRPRPHGRMCAREAGGGSFSGDVGRPGLPWRLPAEWLEEGGGADRWGLGPRRMALYSAALLVMSNCSLAAY